MKFYRYFYNIKEPFIKITDINTTNKTDYLNLIAKKSLASKTYNEDYINKRLATEKEMRRLFIQKGGEPQIEHPHYLVLENCDYWFYSIKNCYASLTIDSSLFKNKVISFTYGDSIPTFDDNFFDGKEYRRNIYTINEIKHLIEKYSLPQLWNQDCRYGVENYIEVQIWSDEIISLYNFNNTENIYDSLDLFFNSVVDGNTPIKAVLETFPEQILLKEIKKMFDKSKCSFINELYNKFQKVYLPSKMHGIEHAYRTAIYMFMIGIIAKVDKDYLKTMVFTAFAHDIGRKYSTDQKHGLVGANMIDTYIDVFEKNTFMIKRAITAHSIQDYNLYIHINSGNDKENQLLQWLKDVDTLDYIRFGIKGYKPDLIKTQEAKKLVKIAAELNLYMEIYPNDDYKILK